MNQDQLQALERAFEKAKHASGPQALATFATENAPALFAAVRASLPELGVSHEFAALQALYPGVTDKALFDHAASDIKALRADRAKRAGYETEAEPLDAEFAGGFTPGDYVDALRPLARLADPTIGATIAAAASNAGVEWDGQALITIADDGVVLAQISKAEAERAHTIVSAFEGEAN